MGYPSVLKIYGIAPKSTSIWSKFLSQRFFFSGTSNRRGLNVGIGSPDLYQRFSKKINKVKKERRERHKDFERNVGFNFVVGWNTGGPKRIFLGRVLKSHGSPPWSMNSSISVHSDNKLWLMTIWCVIFLVNKSTHVRGNSTLYWNNFGYTQFSFLKITVDVHMLKKCLMYKKFKRTSTWTVTLIWEAG